jgi:chromosome segregation ATPase
MDSSFDVGKQEILELAEQFCGGYIRNYRHGLEKIRDLLVSTNLSHSKTMKSTISKSRNSLRSTKKKDSLGSPETEDLLSEVKKCRQIILTQQEKISSIPGLESDLKEAKKQIQIETSKLTNKYNSDLSHYQKELKHHNKVLAKNLQLEEKVKLLTMEIESFRRQFHKEMDVDGRVTQLQELSVARNKEIQKLEINGNRLKVQLDLKTQEVQKLSAKVLELEAKIEEIKKTPKIAEKEKFDQSETNALMVSFYKKKLEEKEIEIKKLNTRVCKMQRTEIQCKIKEEGFDNERKEFRDRIAQLCENSKSLEKIVKEKLSASNFPKDENKRNVLFSTANYENMAELAKSASEAYSTVVSKERLTSRSTRPTTAVDSRAWSARKLTSNKFHMF